MALAKQNIPVSLSQGINTKIDDKQAVAGTLTVLENMVFTTINMLRKRYGYNSLSSLEINGSAITNTKSITSFKNELNLYSDQRFYTHSDAIDRWVDKGRVFNIIPSSTPILRNSYEQTGLAINCLTDVNVYAWEDSRGGIRISVVDNENNSSFLSDTEISASGSNPKIAKITSQGKFFIFYTVGTTLRYKTIQTYDPTNVSTESTMFSNIDSSNPAYDVIELQESLVIAYNSSAANKLQIFTKNEFGTTIATTSIAETASESIRLTSDSTDSIVVAYANTTDVKVTAYNLPLSIVKLSPTTIETISNVVHVSIHNHSSDIFDVIYEISATSSTDHYIKKNTVDLSAVIDTPVTLLKSVGLSSHIYQYNSINYFNIVHDSELQDTYFVSDIEGNLVAKISSGLGGGIITRNKLNAVCEPGDSKFIFTSQIKGRVISQDNTLYSLLGVNSTIIDFDPDTQYQDEVLGDNLHIAGGIIQTYDGNVVVEHGFHLFPEGLTAGTNSASGGYMSNGTYQYKAVYAWTDNKGQIHRSPTSLAFDVVTTAGGTTQTQDIDVPTLRLTKKENVIIELYRTEDLGTIFYKVTTVATPEFNNKTVDSITITDSISDADLIDNELLYDTGGILQNDAPPSATFIKTYGDRIILSGLESPNVIAYSKIREEGSPVAFNNNLTMRLDPDGGPIRALGIMDEKLIIFKESRIYFFAGEGPTNAGTLDNFTEPQQVASDVGCIRANSVVLTPQGLMFKSSKGIYLLDRSLQAIYIGAAVEEYNDLIITSAILTGETNQVRFTTRTGVCLVYDYLMNQWSTFTNYSARDALVLNNDYYFLKTDGKVKKEDTSIYTDEGSPIEVTFETSWLTFAGLQGFQRVYKMLALGEIHSRHKMRIRVAYDYANSYLQEVTIDSSDFTDFTPYGGDSPYGLPTTKPYGGVANRYQFEVKFKKQKCEAIRLRFEEIQDIEIGEGLSLSGITFYAGGKQGIFQVSRNRKYGTN